MRTMRCTLALAALLALAAATLGHAQSARPAFLDSDIRLVVDYPAIVSKAFVSTPVEPLHKGTVLPAKGILGPLGLTQMWSLRSHAFTLGSQTLVYPVAGSVRCSNFSDTGSFTRVIASATQVKVAIKAGEVLHSGGYLIEAGQAIRAGETIPTLLVIFSGKTFILSLEEAARSQKKELAAQPRLSIVSERASAADRGIALEAWRTANQSARAGLYAATR
jgi:hypothetical protein